MSNNLDLTLQRFGAVARGWVSRNPWTNVYGLSRSILAAATAGTLAFNSINVLFTPSASVPMGPLCLERGGFSTPPSLFCLVGVEHLDLARWLCVAILLIV